METKNYTFKPEKKILKQGYFMTDESGQTVYEAKVLKQPLLGAAQVLFVNHITNKEEEHKVGKTVTTESMRNDDFRTFQQNSYFKMDNDNIWTYIHEKGLDVESNRIKGKLSFEYEISLNGQSIASMAMASKGLIGSTSEFNITTSEEYLDLVFLVAFAIAKTDKPVMD